MRLQATLFATRVMGRNTVCLSFAQVMDLLTMAGEGDIDIDGIASDQIAETLARLWDACSQGITRSEIFDLAQAAGGLATRHGRTPTGHYRIHLYDRFVLYSRIPEKGPAIPCLPAGTHPVPEIAQQLADRFGSDQRVLPIADFVDMPPSAHSRLTTQIKANAWLDWLAPTQGWPKLAPVQHIELWTWENS